MGYTLWLKIENDDGNPGDRDEGWTALAYCETRAEVEARGNRALRILSAARRLPNEEPYYSEPLDGWHQEDEDDA